MHRKLLSTGFKDMPHKISRAVTKAIKAAGSAKALALALGVKEQSVNKWWRIPRNRIAAVHKATGIPLEELAPDLYNKNGPFRWRKS